MYDVRLAYPPAALIVRYAGLPGARLEFPGQVVHRDAPRRGDPTRNSTCKGLYTKQGPEV